MRTQQMIAGLILYYCVVTTGVYAQRTIDKTPTSLGCFRQPVTPLDAVPPYRPDMHPDCVQGYMFLDSLCRLKVNRAQLEVMFAQINSLQKLKPLMRYHYRMSEYDATLFGEYFYGGPYVQARSFAGPGIDSERYVSGPAVINYGFIAEPMQKLLGRKHKLCYLTFADHILRIRVEAVVDDVDRLASIPVGPLPLKCITARVIDTIKGIHIRQCEGADTVGTPCVSFYFSPYWQKENYRGDVISIGVNEETGEEHIPCDNCFADTSIYAGKEYIVFLNNQVFDYDGTFAYYGFTPLFHFSAEGGIFPILPNGSVSIPSDFFGYGREVPYDRFLELIRKDIDYITSP